MSDEIKIELDEEPIEVRVCLQCGEQISTFPVDVGSVVTCSKCGHKVQTGDWVPPSINKPDVLITPTFSGGDRDTINKCIIGLHIQLIAAVGVLASVAISLNQKSGDSLFLWVGIGLGCRFLGLFGYLGCGKLQKAATNANDFAFAFWLEMIGLFFIGTSAALHLGTWDEDNGRKEVLKSVGTVCAVAGCLMVALGYFAFMFDLSWLARHLKRRYIAVQIIVFLWVSFAIAFVSGTGALEGTTISGSEPTLFVRFIQACILLMQIWFLFLLACLIQAAQNYRRLIPEGEKP